MLRIHEFPMKDRAFSEDGSNLGISDDEEDNSDSCRRASSSGGATSDEAENKYFGQSENRKVRTLKVLVILVLFLVTLAVCLVVYFLTSAGQQHEFEAS